MLGLRFHGEPGTPESGDTRVGRYVGQATGAPSEINNDITHRQLVPKRHGGYIYTHYRNGTLKYANLVIDAASYESLSE